MSCQQSHTQHKKRSETMQDNQILWSLPKHHSFDGTKTVWYLWEIEARWKVCLYTCIRTIYSINKLLHCVTLSAIVLLTINFQIQATNFTILKILYLNNKMYYYYKVFSKWDTVYTLNAQLISGLFQALNKEYCPITLYSRGVGRGGSKGSDELPFQPRIYFKNS